jgi:hypothetical protein
MRVDRHKDRNPYASPSARNQASPLKSQVHTWLGFSVLALLELLSFGSILMGLRDLLDTTSFMGKLVNADGASRFFEERVSADRKRKRHGYTPIGSSIEQR